MLEAIVREKYKEVTEAKVQRPLESFIKEIQPGKNRLRQSLTLSNWALIAECKLASPVKGTFRQGRKVGELAAIYAANSATALSVLTDKHFCGSLDDIAAAREVCSLPILRKDFIIDPYQIYEARFAQADAILLIAAILSDDQLRDYLDLAHELGMDCLVETHTLAELKRVLATSAFIVGINNRDLKTFTTDINTTHELLSYCNSERLVISESGVRTAADAMQLKAWGVKGILVGEGLVTAPDIAAKTRELALQNG